MARLLGIDLPNKKRIEAGLTYLYGVGPARSREVLRESGVSGNTRVGDLTEDELARIRKVIETRFKVEGELRKEVTVNVKRLMDLGTYRGLRHRRNLPVRGQRTRTNARTRKGPRRASVAIKKKEAVRK